MVKTPVAANGVYAVDEPYAPSTEERLAQELQQARAQIEQLQRQGSHPLRSRRPSVDNTQVVNKENRSDLIRAVVTLAILAVAYMTFNTVPAPVEAATGQSPCIPPSISLTQGLGAVVAIAGCVAAASYPSYSAVGFQPRSVGFVVGLLLILFSYGNIAHSQNWSALLSFVLYSTSLVLLVIVELQGNSVMCAQEAAAVGLLIGGALSSFVSLNSCVFCFGLFFASLSSLQAIAQQGYIRVGDRNLKH